METFVRETDALYDLYVDGEVISTTGEHPFWVPNLGWVEAKDLTVGSLLQTEDGRIIDVDGVEKREGKFEVYNFEVEGFHTYFVSDLGVLVHNTCDGYVPKDPDTGLPLPLPRDKYGNLAPSSEYPHTQIGWREGRKGGYKQTREWGSDGHPIRDIDWTWSLD